MKKKEKQGAENNVNIFEEAPQLVFSFSRPPLRLLTSSSSLVLSTSTRLLLLHHTSSPPIRLVKLRRFGNMFVVRSERE